MRTDIMPSLIEASAKTGGLSWYELTALRELHPGLSHIFDLIEDLQEQLEDVVPAEEYKLLDKHLDEKLADIGDHLRDIESEYALIEDKIVGVRGQPYEASDLTDEDMIDIANALSDMHEAIKFANLEIET